MPTLEVRNYVSQSRASGMTNEQISQSLMAQGWTQQQANEALGLAPLPPTAPLSVGMPDGSFAPTAGFLDAKTKETVMWSIIGYFTREIIVTVASGIIGVILTKIFLYYLPGGFRLNIAGVIISSMLYGGIAGLLLVKFYSQIQKINQQYFKGWFNSLYKLIFYPSVIGGILGLLLGGGLTLSFFGTNVVGVYILVALVINIVAQILGSYAYAKIMVAKVGKYY